MRSRSSSYRRVAPPGEAMPRRTVVPFSSDPRHHRVEQPPRHGVPSTDTSRSPADAGLGGGALLEHARDHDLLAALGHLQADAVVLALVALAQGLQLLGVEVVGVRVAPSMIPWTDERSSLVASIGS